MYDLVTVGDVTIDLYFKGDSLTSNNGRFDLAIGGKYPVDFFYEGVGGGAANVAIGASNNGLSTAVLAKVGENSFKQIILQKLLKKMVSTEFLLIDNDFMNISTILLSNSGEKTVIHHATPHEKLDVSDVMLRNMLNAKALFMGSLPGISIPERVKLLTYFKTNNKKVYLGIGAPEIEKGIDAIKPLLDTADVLFLNTYEYADLIKKKLPAGRQEKESIDFKKDCAKNIGFEKKILIITDGANGSYVYSNGTVHHQVAFKASIKDTTGAGDGFCAGFIAAYLKEASIEESMKSAAMYAMKILEKVGAN